MIDYIKYQDGKYVSKCKDCGIVFMTHKYDYSCDRKECRKNIEGLQLDLFKDS